jgi:hypothetical protein
MKELKDYTEFDLQHELERRENEKYEEEALRLPEEFLPYKEVEEFKHTDHCKYFNAHIDDGCEGHDYLIQYNYRKNDYDHAGEEDQLINDTVRHSYLTAALEGGWDANLEDIRINEIGHYGVSLFTIDATKRPEEDDE